VHLRVRQAIGQREVLEAQAIEARDSIAGGDPQEAVFIAGHAIDHVARHAFAGLPGAAQV
jgi:hypothetical protein